jgi:hypothetical protein
MRTGPSDGGFFHIKGKMKMRKRVNLLREQGLRSLLTV